MSKTDLPSPAEFIQLRAFIAVAQTLSFRRAADQLGVSSPAVSQAVRALETRLGVPLLNRTTRSVALSEAGRRLFDRTTPAAQDLTAALDETRRSGPRPTGTLRVQAFRVAAELFLRPMLRRFHEEHPDVVLDVTLDDEVSDFTAAGFDAAIRVGEVIAQDMIAVRLGPDLRQVAAASPDYLARRGTPTHPRDLAAHACIGWRWEGHAHPHRWEFNNGEGWFEVAVTSPFISNDREFGVQAALEGLGIAFAIEEVTAPFVADGRLTPVLQAWSAPFPGFHLCFPARRSVSPALRAFIDAVRAGPGRKPDGV